MTTYEIVKRAIKFERPERIPFTFRSLGCSDVAWVAPSPPKNWKPLKMPEGEWIDEWGCHWKRLLKDGGQPIGHPLENWDNFMEYKWPDPDAAGSSRRHKETG